MEGRASVSPTVRNWRSSVDTKEETYHPTHIPWLSENLPFLAISTPFAQRYTPYSHHQAQFLKLFPCSDSWDWGPWSPFPSSGASLGAGLLTWRHCCRMLSLSQAPYLSSQEHLPSSQCGSPESSLWVSDFLGLLPILGFVSSWGKHSLSLPLFGSLENVCDGGQGSTELLKPGKAMMLTVDQGLWDVQEETQPLHSRSLSKK